MAQMAGTAAQFIDALEQRHLPPFEQILVLARCLEKAQGSLEMVHAAAHTVFFTRLMVRKPLEDARTLIDVMDKTAFVRLGLLAGGRGRVGLGLACKDLQQTRAKAKAQLPAEWAEAAKAATLHGHTGEVHRPLLMTVDRRLISTFCESLSYAAAMLL